MMASRDQFFEDVRSIRHAAQLDIVSGNQEVGSVEAGSAAIMRRGLAVIAFASFERFVKDRTEELVRDFNEKSPLRYEELPAKLGERFRVNSTEVYLRQMQRVESGQREIDLAERLGMSLASINAERAMLSPESLGWSGSNINFDDLKGGLEALGFKGPSNLLNDLLKRISNQKVESSAAELFRAFSVRRHNAAHDASFHVSIVVARSLYRDLLLLGVATDILLSVGFSSLNSGAKAEDLSALLLVRVQKVARGRRYRILGADSGKTTYESPDDCHRKKTRKSTNGAPAIVVLEVDDDHAPVSLVT